MTDPTPTGREPTRRASAKMRAEPAIDCVMTQFKRGGALVEVALAALARLREDIDGGGCGETMAAAVEAATFDGDNLLVDEPSRREMTIFVLARQTGGGVRVQTIAIDRGPIAVTRPDGTGPLDRYCAAETTVDRTTARNALRNRISAAASSLSIVKSRLDLQESFLDSVLQDEPAGSPKVLRPDFSQANIRDLALSVGRQLDRRGMSLGSRNRRTLETLFAKAMTGA